MSKALEAMVALNIDRRGVALKRLSEYISTLEAALEVLAVTNSRPRVHNVGQGTSEEALVRLVNNASVVRTWSRSFPERAGVPSRDVGAIFSKALRSLVRVEALSAAPEGCRALLVDQSSQAAGTKSYSAEDELRRFIAFGKLLRWAPDASVESVFLAYLRRFDQLAANNYYCKTHRSVDRIRVGPFTVADGASIRDFHRPRVWLDSDGMPTFVDHIVRLTRSTSSPWWSTYFAPTLEKHLLPYPQVMYFYVNGPDIRVQAFPVINGDGNA